MKRDDVITIPGVIDFDSFPAAASKQEMGLDPERFIFLYIFDVSSSMERKNPEAAIRAFSLAFAKNEKVQLGTFAETATFGEIVLNVLQGAVTINTLKSISASSFDGKVIIDVSNPLDFSKGFPPTLSEGLNNDN